MYKMSTTTVTYLLKPTKPGKYLLLLPNTIATLTNSPLTGNTCEGVC